MTDTTKKERIRILEIFNNDLFTDNKEVFKKLIE